MLFKFAQAWEPYPQSSLRLTLQDKINYASELVAMSPELFCQPDVEEVKAVFVRIGKTVILRCDFTLDLHATDPPR